ncbi:MAG: hypothetical protein WAR39_07825 [Prevotella sp.]
MIDPVYASLLIAALGFGLNLYTVSKGNAKNAEQTGRVLQSVDNLKDDVRDIKSSIKDSSRQIGDIDRRVSVLENRVTVIEEEIK